jgi:hypothetical protein
MAMAVECKSDIYLRTKQNPTTSDNVEAIRLAVEVVCLMRRFGYLVKDDAVLEVIELCSKVAK